METVRLGKTNMMVSKLGFEGIPIQRVSDKLKLTGGFTIGQNQLLLNFNIMA